MRYMQLTPSKHKVFVYNLRNVEPTSKTLGRRSTKLMLYKCFVFAGQLDALLFTFFFIYFYLFKSLALLSGNWKRQCIKTDVRLMLELLTWKVFPTFQVSSCCCLPSHYMYFVSAALGVFGSHDPWDVRVQLIHIHICEMRGERRLGQRPRCRRHGFVDMSSNDGSYESSIILSSRLNA